MLAYEFYRLKALITLEQVNTTEWSKKIRILISKIAMIGCCKLSLYANAWWAYDLFSARIETTCHVNHFFDVLHWCNFRVFIHAYSLLPGEVLLVVASKRTKLIQKQISSMDVDKVGSKRPLASKSVSPISKALCLSYKTSTAFPGFSPTRPTELSTEPYRRAGRREPWERGW